MFTHEKKVEEDGDKEIKITETDVYEHDKKVVSAEMNTVDIKEN